MSNMSDRKWLEADPELLNKNSGTDEGCKQLAVETHEQALARLNHSAGQFFADSLQKRTPWHRQAAKRELMLKLHSAVYPPLELDFWLRLKFLTPAQALPLLCGFCQDIDDDASASHVRLDGFRLFDDSAMAHIDGDEVEEMRQDFTIKHRRLKILWAGEGRGDKPLPLSDFLAWAKTNRVKVEWLEWAVANGYGDAVGEPSAANTPSDDSSFTEKERRSVLIIVAGLCKKCNIDFTTRGASSGITKAVDGLGNGISIDPKTVDKYLKQIPGALGARGL